jgi:uncharacterized hydrophobic protein (TIGR00271 family)
VSTHPFHDVATRIQDRALAALGGAPGERQRAVVGVLERSRRDAASYYLQLVIATGMSVLGLVLGSTAVIIGAMLVSPLMGPIVQLGMGLAVGSPVLLVRALSRNTVSLVLVIAGAAAVVRLLPFQAINSEITGRTTPTVLDLLIAMFCALAALYTTVRQTSDTQSAAAGTAIGISLVPPLCVVGYGIGTAAWDVALGATLLFVANFSAIMLVSTLGLVILGYSQVPVAEIDAAELAASRGGRATTLERWLERLFQSNVGPLLRLLAPALLLAAVFVPLRRALEEVGWEVRVRTAVSSLVAHLDVEAVSSAVTVQRHSVGVRLVMVGAPEQARDIAESLEERIRAVSGVTPSVEVVAVPDPEAMRAAVDSMRSSATAVAIGAYEASARSFARDLEAAITASWPATAGSRWGVRVQPGTTHLIVEFVHAGPALGPVALELLGNAVGRALSVASQAREVVVPRELTATDASEFAVAVASMATATAGFDGYHVCVGVPPAQQPAAARRRRATAPPPTAPTTALEVFATQFPHVRIREASELRAEVRRGDCAAATTRPDVILGETEPAVPDASAKRASEAGP